MQSSVKERKVNLKVDPNRDNLSEGEKGQEGDEEDLTVGN